MTILPFMAFGRPRLQGPPSARPRVFCIGLDKTGTTSFHNAMQILGYKSLHWGGTQTRDAVKQAYAKRLPILANLDPSYEAFSNIDFLAVHFDLVDRQYPGSRFVYTTRSIEDWLASKRRHVERNLVRRARGEYFGNNLIVDEQQWHRRFKKHRKRVVKYFKARSDFIELDIASELKWKSLCGLLGCAIPAEPYPHSNKSAQFNKQPEESR